MKQIFQLGMKRLLMTSSTGQVEMAIQYVCNSLRLAELDDHSSTRI